MNTSLSRLAAFMRSGLRLGSGRFSFDTFGVLPIHKARATGCLRLLGWRGGAYPEGVELFAVHGAHFSTPSSGLSSGHFHKFSYRGTDMKQLGDARPLDKTRKSASGYEERVWEAVSA